MIINFENESFEFNNVFELDKKLNRNYESDFEIKFEIDDFAEEKIKLLVTLSPIFNAIFDNGKKDEYCSFLKDLSKKSKYEYALYDNFFSDFNLKNIEKNTTEFEDINIKDGFICFKFNNLANKYILGLVSMIETLVLNTSQRKLLLNYFKDLSDVIVKNSRRAVISNGNRAFILSKYVVVWFMELVKIIRIKFPDNYKYVKAIENLNLNLKLPKEDLI
ncbi:MAG: hypothetical protein SOZ89_01260 [Peptoniphilaceae bacterium]|nr:hypothetical protein [Peptoniphilaceae bacterium]MDY3737730.1 hypothetical protein [Peptoniphilaceae bacterium]